MQKGRNLPAFHGARFQRCYGLGSIFKDLFRWAMPHLQQGAKMIGKKALQTGVNVAQDILDGDNLKTAIRKQAKQAIANMTSQKSRQAQSVVGQKGTKRKAQGSKISSPPGKKAKASELGPLFFNKKIMAFVHHKSRECTTSELDLFTIPLFTKGNGLNITLSATSRTLVLLNLTYLEPEKNI